ncbi:MAG: helix-turn-helix transcriptional regulator [Gemmatimonadaceae bacterium]
MSSIEYVFSVFLTPFDGTPAEWRDRAATAFKEFLGADYSMYSEHTIGGMSYSMPDAPQSGLDKLNAIGEEMAREIPIHPLMRRAMELERTGRLPVFTTPLLNSLLDGRFEETPFFIDLMQPAGMKHIACLVSVGATVTRRLAVGWDRKRRVDLGPRMLTTLRRLHPAFDAACRLIDQAELSRQTLLTTIDSSTDGMTLILPDGQTLHQNPSLRRMIAMEDASNSIESAIEKCAAASVRRTMNWNSPTGSTMVQGQHGREYTLYASALSGTFGIPQHTTLVTVIEATAQLPLVGEIQRRFGLTSRQAQVARLLAGRLSDAEIASRLGVSWHTIRSHVDHIFVAMRVNSRQQIAELISKHDRHD